MDQLLSASAVELAAAIRTKQVSSVEIVDACLERIEAVNPTLNAVVQLAADTARAQAQQADQALARDKLHGPLHGVPMTIKDSLDTAGIISTGGTMGRAAFVPKGDATVVARLRDAGAILLGKTNTPEFTMSFETDNLVYGRTSNPYNPSRTSGGSSGGAAAIIAVGGAPFDIGSDYGGSIRLPAHCCGITGIKPTSGRVPRTGHALPFGGLLDSFQQLGPLARCVDDLNLLLPLIAGPDWIDPAIVPMPLGDPADVELKKLRVAFYADNGIVSPTPETIATVRKAVSALDDSVLLVEEVRPPGIEQTYDLMIGLNMSDGSAGIKRLLRQAGTTQHTFEGLDEPPPFSAAQVDGLVTWWYTFRSTMLSFFKNYDVIVCPVNAYPALPHGQTKRNWPGFSYTMTYNLTGWPGAVVRGGTSPQGLPIGVQIVAQPWREDVALAVAGHLEQALGGFEAPPL